MTLSNFNCTNDIFNVFNKELRRESEGKMLGIVPYAELVSYAEIEHMVRSCGDYIVEFLVSQTLPPESEMVVYEFLRQHKLPF